MRHQATIALFQYWDRLRGDRPAPQRTEIEPVDIKSLLADTFILEKDARGEAIFRLAGTRLCATYGRELKGYSFPLLWSQRDQRIVSRHAYSAFHHNSVVVVGFDGIGANGKTAEFEMVLLPLEGGHGSPRSLGAITPSTKPYWLGAIPVVENRLTTLRIVDPDRERLFLGDRPMIGGPSIMPDQAEITANGVDGGRRIKHLVVFEGGKDD